MTEKLDMMSKNNVQANIEKIKALFPNAVTEVLRNGKPTLAVDFDVLKQEMSDSLIDDKEERYQFTWPDKKKSILLANSPISATLRPCKEESVDFDNTQNLYIEGDNLDVLKLLQETYLGKVKMIYIDPPYNTGNDFVYNDDFAESSEEYLANSGQFDEQGNRLVANTESNGRFHTDWLNMIYPRLKVAKDLLSDDGVIFISIDDCEIDNLSKLCEEVFGAGNFICKFIWKSKLGKVGTTSTISATHEYILCYAKKYENVSFTMIKNESEGRKESLRQWGVADRREDRPSMWYPITIEGTTVYPIKEDGTEGRWRVGKEMAEQLLREGVLELGEKNGKYNIYRNFPSGISYIPYDTLLLDNIGTTAKGATLLKSLEMAKVFDFSKPIELVKHFAYLCTNGNDIILDFFSGSATTAHAVMQLNAEDGGNRKFIMVQLPEKCDEKSEAYKAGYKTICEIGKERIRRAGKKIKEDRLTKIDIDKTKLMQRTLLDNGEFDDKYALKVTPANDDEVLDNLDVGFRVLKLDESNMKPVYYRPEQYQQTLLDDLTDNIKEDRTPLDLLFQVMLDLGKPLSAKIEEKEIAGKRVFIVNDDDLIACFNKDVTSDVVKAIAEMKPLYAVFRDSSLADDCVGANFDQIFATYSPNTTRKVL